MSSDAVVGTVDELRRLCAPTPSVAGATINCDAIDEVDLINLILTLCQVVEQNRRLHTLVVVNMPMGRADPVREAALERFFDAVGQSTTLCSLTLKDTMRRGGLAARHAHGLAHAVRVNKSLERLEVHGISFGSKSQSKFFAAFAHNTGIRELLVERFWCLGMTGLRALAKSLSTNTTLWTVGLVRCGSTPENMAEFFRELANRRTHFLHLFLRGTNPFVQSSIVGPPDPASVASARRALTRFISKRGDMLVTLDLRSCGISIDKQFVDALQWEDGPETFLLDNAVDDEGPHGDDNRLEIDASTVIRLTAAAPGLRLPAKHMPARRTTRSSARNSTCLAPAPAAKRVDRVPEPPARRCSARLAAKHAQAASKAVESAVRDQRKAFLQSVFADREHRLKELEDAHAAVLATAALGRMRKAYEMDGDDEPSRARVKRA